ncbi:hypothetical protein [Janibacter hoylei]|uniref:hypothetical protein n=1 Tax=Janibacter hoylei TaxID=364298 RepID=UPI001EDEA3FF|nr:hypothetical protein [Janibacter hoylei]
MSTAGRKRPAIHRRVVLVGTVGMVLGLTACSSTPPVDEGEVRAAVSKVEGVSSVEVRVRKGGGVSGWKLEGRVGLPADEAEAHAVYEECLRALSTVPVKAGANFKIRLFGESSGKVIPPSNVGVPDTWGALREHFA